MSKNIGLFVFILTLLCGGVPVCGESPVGIRGGNGEGMDVAPPAPRAEGSGGSTDYGYDTYEGETRKIRRVIAVNPSSITVIYEGGGSRKVSRQDLAEPLKSLYPYDAKRAEAYESEEQRRRLRQQQVQGEAVRAGLLRQQLELGGQIRAIMEQNGRLQEEIDDLNRQIRTQPRKASLRQQKNQYIEQQKLLRRRIDGIRDRLQAVELKLKQIP